MSRSVSLITGVLGRTHRVILIYLIRPDCFQFAKGCVFGAALSDCFVWLVTIVTVYVISTITCLLFRGILTAQLRGSLFI